MQQSNNRKVRGQRHFSEVIVTDWDSFRKAWKPTDFLKGIDQMDEKQREMKLMQKLKQLVEDKEKACYLFPNSLKDLTRELLKNIISSEEFDGQLDCEYQSLFMGKPKQLLIYKKISSLMIYLQKYRMPNEYKDVNNQLNKNLIKYQELKIKKNVIISHQYPDEELKLKEVSEAIENYRQEKLQKSIEKYEKLLNNILEDFVQQPKKQTIVIVTVKSGICQILKRLCVQHQIYLTNRFINISDYDEHKDIIIQKVDPDVEAKQLEEMYKNREYDSQSQEQKGQKAKKQEAVEIKQEFYPPSKINEVSLKQIKTNGASCYVSFDNDTFFKVQELEVNLAHPKITENQKNYKRIYKIQEKCQQFQLTLPPLNQGYAEYELKTRNNLGQSKPYFMKIWNQVDPTSENQQGFYEISQKNYQVYQLGKNAQGVIPKQNQEEPLISTQEKWKPLNFKATNFSVSSNVSICNSKGDVASWGTLPIHQENEDQETQEDENNFVNVRVPNYQIQNPCLLLSGESIRKISCGQGYCLMSDYLGRAWGYGVNDYGQLGLEHMNSYIDTSNPLLIPMFKKQDIFVVDVVASYFGASFAIDNEGKAYRWGANQMQSTEYPVKDSYNNIINFEYGNTLYKVPNPVVISKKIIDEPIKSIHPGVQYVLALTVKNEVYGWGKCQFLGAGQIQNSHFKSINYITNPIPIIKNIVRVSVGIKHSLVLNEKGEVYGWGNSLYLTGKQGFYKKPELLRENYTGIIECGPELTVLEKGQGAVEIIGDKTNFESEVYELPEKQVVKLKAAQGVLMGIFK